MFGKRKRRTARDSDRVNRAMQEIRNLQSTDFRRAAERYATKQARAHDEFLQELDRVERQLDNIQHLCAIVVHDGANLPDNLSTRERREAVNKARAQLDGLLDTLETARREEREAREKRQRQQRCEHTWEPLETETGEDGHLHVTKGRCRECELDLPVPSDAQVELERTLNAETEKVEPSKLTVPEIVAGTKTIGEAP
jgi:hypothetical protein